MSKLNDQRVVRELYDSILREVVDEVNVPISSLSQPNFIGVAQNISAGKRPSSEFIIRFLGLNKAVHNVCGFFFYKITWE